MTEKQIDETSPPELADLPEDFWADAELITVPAKEAISLRVDEDVLRWFREGGARYQSRMNAVLRSYMQAMKRSQAIEAAVTEKLDRLERRRLAVECATLDPAAEQAMAEEGIGADLASWPGY